MSKTNLIIGNTTLILFMGMLVLKAYYYFISRSKLYSLIKEYYSDYATVEILDLNFKERLRYKAPLNIILQFYIYIFKIFFSLSLKISFIKKIELADVNNNMQTRYAEFQISKRKIISCNVLDTYEI